jgi:hypothetical protein
MTYSQNVKAVQARIKRLPRIYKDKIESMRKRDANDFIAYWRSGLLNNEFKLTPLADSTIARKIRLAYAKPQNPLYGLGFEGAHTYIKGMRIFRTKEGYVVRMTGKHHDSKIDNHGLLLIHEYGCTYKDGHRLPARPAMHEAYKRVLKDIKKRDSAMTRSINRYLRSGEWKD